MRLWRGCWLAVGTSSALTVLPTACGDTNNNTTNVFAGAEGGDVGSSDARDSSIVYPDLDAADPDAPYEGPGCANDKRPTSNRCEVVRRCLTGECGAKDSILYRCFGSGAGSRPPIEGCNSLGPTDGGEQEQWCCPPACVTYASGNASTCPGKTIYSCPAIFGGPTVEPSPSCGAPFFSDPSASYALYCCP